MEQTETYEAFPLRIVLLSSLVSLAIYALGAYILAGFGLLWLLLYLAYCLAIEIWVLKSSCVNCYYYGRLCGLGKGKLCAWVFPKGDPQKFATREVSFLHLLPDFLVFLIPVAGGIILMVARGFAWPILIALGLLVLLSFGGNAIVRGSFACKYCKQRALGCPAEKVFQKRS